MHPLESGMFRRKYRRDRRPILPRENPLVFYPRYAWETATKLVRAGVLLARYQLLLRRVMRAEVGDAGNDVAMQPVSDREMDEIGLFTVSDAARSAVAQSRKKATAKGVAVGT